MKITTKTDYAVILLTTLAKTPQKAVSLELIAEDNHLSEAYLQRIAALLKKAGLVVPKLGAHGGYTLTYPAHEITLLDVVEAVGDSLYTTRCCSPEATCPLQATCPGANRWGKFQQKITHVFENTTIKNMLNE